MPRIHTSLILALRRHQVKLATFVWYNRVKRSGRVR